MLRQNEICSWCTDIQRNFSCHWCKDKVLENVRLSGKDLIHMHSRIIVTFLLVNKMSGTRQIVLSYPFQYSQWSLHAHVCRQAEANTLHLKFLFVINSKLQSLRQHTDHIYNASLLVPGVSKMLSLLACKMSCFSFTSCFPSLSSVSNQMYFHSSFLSGNLYFPHFTPPLALDLSSVWVCLRQRVCSCFFPLP